MPPQITSKIHVADAAMAEVPKAQKLKQRTKFSNFLLTISTNKPIATDSPEFEPFRRRFKGLIEKMIGGDNILRYITYKEAGGSADKIEAINCETSIEVGGAHNKSIHCHSVIQIKHTTLLHLDQMKMRHVVKRAMGINGNCHLNIKMVGRTAQIDLQTALGYIRKDVKTEVEPKDVNETDDTTAEYV